MADWKPLPITTEAVESQLDKSGDSPSSRLGQELNFIQDNIAKGVAGIPGFFGDVITESSKMVANMARQGLRPNVQDTMKDVHIPGAGTASRTMQTIKTQALGPDVPAKNKRQQYEGAAIQGVVGAAAPGSFGSLPNIIKTVAIGGSAGVAAEGAHELFPNSEVAPLAAGFLAMLGAHRVTSGFGAREAPKAGASTYHQGIDIATASGTPVPSPMGGRVIDVKDTPKGGREVVIDHGNGYVSHYLHLSEIDVKPGDILNKGDHFAKTGATGNVTGPHLHWAVYKDGKPVDPRLVNEAPDGLPGNAGVPPMDPKVIARIMGEDPEAIGKVPESADDGIMPEDNVVDLGEVRHQKDYEAASGMIDHLYDNVRDMNEKIVEGGHKSSIEGLENTRSLIASEMNNYHPDSSEFAKLSEIDDMLKESIAYQGGKPRVYSPDASEKFMQGERQEPANDMSEQDAADREGVYGFNVGDEGGQPPREPPSEPPSGGGEEPPSRPPDEDYRGLTPEQKVVKGIREAKPTAHEQRSLIHEARQKQNAVLSALQKNNASYHEQLASLAGELPGADYTSIRHNFTPNDVKVLEGMVNGSTRLRTFEKVNALKSLHKLLSDQGVKIPTNLELKNLSEVFSPDLIKAIMEKNRNLGDTIKDVLNVPRTVMSAGDVSAPARQGLFFVTRKEFWKNYPAMIKMLGSEKAYQAAMSEIKDRPTYGAMKDAGLYFADRNFLSGREEAFMSNLAEKIPLYGKLIRASDRAYSGYLNRLRADVFDTLYKQGDIQGVNWNNKTKLKALGNYINTGSGRGSLGQFEQAATAASTIFFSPRLIASRVSLLNPVYYAKLYKADPFVAKQAMRDLVGLTMTAGVMLGLASLAGADVETDPRSTDFAKIKSGDTRIDITGGFQPYMRLISQLATGERKDSHGKIHSLSNPQYGEPTRFDQMAQFGKNKLAPLPGYLANWASQTKNRKFDSVTEAVKMLGPMYASDIIEAVKEQGATGMWVAVPSILGFGVQTYTTPPPKSKKRKRSKNIDKDF